MNFRKPRALRGEMDEKPERGTRRSRMQHAYIRQRHAKHDIGRRKATGVKR